jgi:hypothetical protein
VIGLETPRTDTSSAPRTPPAGSWFLPRRILPIMASRPDALSGLGEPD